MKYFLILLLKKVKYYFSSFVTRHLSFVICHSSFVTRHSSFVTRHSSFIVSRETSTPYPMTPIP